MEGDETVIHNTQTKCEEYELCEGLYKNNFLCSGTSFYLKNGKYFTYRKEAQWQTRV